MKSMLHVRMISAGDLSAKEVAAIMEAHQRELAQALESHNKSRKSHEEKLRERLAEKRRKREEELRSKHVTEVRKWLTNSWSEKFLGTDSV